MTGGNNALCQLLGIKKIGTSPTFIPWFLNLDIVPTGTQCHVEVYPVSWRMAAHPDRVLFPSWLFSSAFIGSKIYDWLLPDKKVCYMTSGLQNHGPILASILWSGRSSSQILYCMDSIPVGQELYNPQEIMWSWRLFGQKMQTHSQNGYLVLWGHTWSFQDGRGLMLSAFHQLGLGLCITYVVLCSKSL